MSIPDDPYFAGRTASKAGPSNGPGDVDGPFVRDWAYVFLANLIVPLLLGLALTADAASLLGLLLSIVILFWSGWRVISASKLVGRALRVGGWLVAFFQIVPVFQMVAGTIGVGGARAVGHATKHGPLTYVEGMPGGFVATIVTGACLMAVALVLGLPIAWAKSWSDRRENWAAKAE